jgi:hypothetical protein
MRLGSSFAGLCDGWSRPIAVRLLAVGALGLLSWAPMGCGASPVRAAAGKSSPTSLGAKAKDSAASRGAVSGDRGGERSGQARLPRALRARKPTVTFTALIRSRCYFSWRLLPTLLEARNDLGSKVKLKVEYISYPALGSGRCKRSKIKPHRGFCALNGKDEVEGNIAQLCAVKLAPSREAWRRFLACSAADWRSVPKNWRRCAGVARIETAPMARCIGGKQGEALLRGSMVRAKLGRQKGSPTLLVNDKFYKGNRDRVALLRTACRLDATLGACKTLPKVAQVKAIVLTDKRCKRCSHSGILNNMRSRFFPGLKLRVVDYASAEGKKLYTKLKLKLLPVWLFDKQVQQADRYQRIKRWMLPLGPYLKLRFPRVGTPPPRSAITAKTIRATARSIAKTAAAAPS